MADERDAPLLRGRWRLGGMVARGAIGHVTSAYDMELGRTVAIKTLDRSGFGIEERFRRGAEVARAIDHPNIPKVYALDLDDAGRPFIAMEFIAEAQDLSRATAVAPLLGDHIAWIGAKLASALSEIHAKGFVHGDVKPSNVLLDRHGSPFLVDFDGFAKFGEPSSYLAYTVMYSSRSGFVMSPEQRHGFPWTAQMDLYSLGALLRRARYGRSSYVEIEPQSFYPAATTDALDRQLVALIDSLTADRPSDRPEKAGQVSRLFADIELAMRSAEVDAWETLSADAAVMTSIQRSLNAEGWTGGAAELARLLKGFRANGIVGPDGRVLADDSHARQQIVTDVRDVNENLISLIKSDPTALWRLSSRKFEELVAEILSRQGYEVTLTPQTRDGGFDMYAATKGGLGRFLFLVEAKRPHPSTKIGVRVVRELHGVVKARRATGGAIVTSSLFTKDAVAEVEAYQMQHEMQLHDYVKLQKWISELPPISKR